MSFYLSFLCICLLVTTITAITAVIITKHSITAPSTVVTTITATVNDYLRRIAEPKGVGFDH